MKKNSLKTSFLPAIAILIIGLITGGLAYAQRPKDLHLVIDDQKVELYTSKRTIREALIEVGYTNLDGAKSNVNIDSLVEDDMSVEVDTRKNVELLLAGTKVELETYANSVQELLEEEQIELDKNDEISPAQNHKLEEGQKVEVNFIDVKAKNVKETIPFQSLEEDSDELYQGESEVRQEGQNGELLKSYQVVYKNGKIFETKKIAEKIVKKPVNEIIVHGNKEKPAEASKPSGGYTMTMTATAYTHTGNPTATGAWPQAYYTVAVDPSVIPLGSSLYIEGYGYGVAQDTGGAIVGNRIDLFFDSEGECVNFGVRDVEVTILD